MASTVKDLQWYAERADYLSGFMLPERFENMRRVVGERTRYMTVCAENTFHPQNASALVRNCEAFGVQDLHAIECLCGFQANVNIVRGTDKWINLYRYRSTAQAIDHMRSHGYRIIAATPHADDSTPEDFDIEASPFCVVLGTEKQGISPETEAAADGFIKIPMQGFVESLNVSASAAILLYILSSRLRQSGVDWRLSPKEQAELLYKWSRESVRDSDNILLKRFSDI